MRKISLLICLATGLGANHSYSQQFTLALDRQSQIAYVGIDNPISCTVEDKSCERVFLSVDNGTIEKTGCNTYIFRPVTPADTKIVIMIKKKNGDSVKVGEIGVRIRKFPQPIASIGGYTEGKVSKAALKAQMGVAASVIAIPIDLKYIVTEFTLCIIRNGQSIFTATNLGNMFIDKTKAALTQLQKDDVVLISSIKVLIATGEVESIKPIELTIAD